MHDELLKLLPQPRATVYSDLGANGLTTASTGPLEWLRRGNSFPNYVSFKDAKPLIARLRTVKDAGELKMISRASDASVAAHLAALKAIHPGVNEREISALMQYEFASGAVSVPRTRHCGFRIFFTVLHYSADDRTMQDGDLVVMDVGGEFSMYATDITRTAPVNGKFTTRQREIYDIVLASQEAPCRRSRRESPSCPRTAPIPILFTKSLLITSTPTAKTFTASRWANILSTDWDITWA